MRTADERYKWAKETASDINQHVSTLARYGNGMKHITEFGVRAGVSTSAWLYVRPSHLVCYDIADCGDWPEIEHIAREQGIVLKFVKANTRDVVIEPTDLLFIDTTHNAETLRDELFHNEASIRKFIILHDTETFGTSGEMGGEGLSVAISQFLAKYPGWVCEEHRRNNNGLTVLARGARSDIS